MLNSECSNSVPDSILYICKMRIIYVYYCIRYADDVFDEIIVLLVLWRDWKYAGDITERFVNLLTLFLFLRHNYFISQHALFNIQLILIQ